MRAADREVIESVILTSMESPGLVCESGFQPTGEPTGFQPVEPQLMVREALLKAGRADLIGSGCDGLIPAHPPKAAIEGRRRKANEVAEGDHYHTLANPAKGETPGERGAGPVKPTGYRPGRKTQKRQQGKKR
jgi:hypothetical protein